MSRPALEVADIFRDRGPAWRREHAGHISLEQLQVMSAIEHCRSAVLGGYVLHCERCEQIQIAYNSCLMGSAFLWGARLSDPTDRRESAANLTLQPVVSDSP